jgi:predicted permease
MDLSQSGYDPMTGPTLFKSMLREVSAATGVESASLAFQLPLVVVGMPSRSFEPEGYARGPREDMNFGYNVISEDYFATMRIPLVSGRPFEPTDDMSAPKVAIVNQPFARKYWPGRDPIGRTVDVGGEKHRVVGMVREIKYVNLSEEPRPYVYLPLSQMYMPQVTLHVRAAGDAAAAQNSVRAAVGRVDSALPLFGVRTLQDQADASLGTFIVATLFLSTAGVQALLLAAIGIYGVVAFSVAQRTREIGIRVALGATPSRVLRLVMGQGLALSIVGLVLGVAIAFASTRILAGLLYGIGPRDPLTFAATAAGLLAVALLACWIPARRALKVSATTALRYE